MQFAELPVHSISERAKSHQAAIAMIFGKTSPLSSVPALFNEIQQWAYGLALGSLLILSPEGWCVTERREKRTLGTTTLIEIGMDWSSLGCPTRLACWSGGGMQCPRPARRPFRLPHPARCRLLVLRSKIAGAARQVLHVARLEREHLTVSCSQ